ncbi:hypothetical protein [Pantanalinema sp. GBBB05]|uniref:hypothetical protein n=1 Tax=Pantanalinema sp. GBBB05 TaxID=2604139 RepID=UPI001D88A004|nr:hypothetical protein [Pantanalinema sp. GBBB05]
MTNPSLNLLDRAKQGDPKAIAALMNRSLQPKGIFVKTELQGDCLEVFLEALDIPEQQTLTAYIRRGLENLRLRSITTVRVYGHKTGDEQPAWSDEFGLEVSEAEDFVSDFESPVQQPRIPSFQGSQTRTFPPASLGSARSTTYQSSPSADSGDQAQEIIQDTIAAFKLFIMNPVGGLPALYEEIGKQRALKVGIVFSLFYIICLLFSVNKTFGMYLEVIKFNFTNILIIGATQILGFWAAIALSRKMFKGYGSIEGDIFIVGISWLSSALLLMISSIIGILNFEAIFFLSMVAISHSTLALYAGCNRISKISEALSPMAVAFSLIFTAWISKVVVTSMLQSMLQNTYRGGL